MSREEAIERWTGILPSVFKAEDKLRPQLQQLLKEHADNQAEGAKLYCRMIAEEIVSHTSDEEVDELQAKLDEATKLEKSMTYNIEHLNADMAQLKYENTTLLKQCEEQRRGSIERIKSRLSKVEGGNV